MSRVAWLLLLATLALAVAIAVQPHETREAIPSVPWETVQP